MDSKGIQIIDLQLCNDFLAHSFGDREFSALPQKDRNCLRAVRFLKEYLVTGEVKPYKKVESVIFYGKTGILIKEYMSSIRTPNIFMNIKKLCLYGQKRRQNQP
jgi:hypothetical protein